MTGWVLLRHESDNLWRQVTAIVAETREDAVEAATSGAENPYQDGTFLVIPAEDWAHQIVWPPEVSCDTHPVKWDLK